MHLKNECCKLAQGIMMLTIAYDTKKGVAYRTYLILRQHLKNECCKRALANASRHVFAFARVL